MNERLKLFIIGGSKGESIVIRTPAGQWGVVDCYCPSLESKIKNPCLQLLKNQEISKEAINELEFLCLTHPHDDHFCGMSHLIEEFTIKKFWRFGGLTHDDLRIMLSVIEAQAGVSCDVELSRSSEELQAIFAAVRVHKKIKTEVQLVINTLLLRDKESGFEIWALSPTNEMISSYREEMLKRLWRNDLEEIKRLKHNAISGALLLKYGKTQVVLCGDVERKAWKSIIPQCQEYGFSFVSQAIKVGHHGSQNGYTDDLWKLFSGNAEPTAVVTPFRQHNLPSETAIQHILSHTKKLYTTSQAATIAPNYKFYDDNDIDFQLASRSIWSGFLPNDDSNIGICAVSFDDLGNSEPVLLYGDAALIGL